MGCCPTLLPLSPEPDRRFGEGPDRALRQLTINPRPLSRGWPQGKILARLTAARWAPAGPRPRALPPQPLRSTRPVPGSHRGQSSRAGPHAQPLGPRRGGLSTANGRRQRTPARAHPPHRPVCPVPGPRRPPVGRTRGMIWWPSSLSWLELQTYSSLAAAAAATRAPPLLLQQPSLRPSVPAGQSEALKSARTRVRELARNLRAEGAGRGVRWLRGTAEHAPTHTAPVL